MNHRARKVCCPPTTCVEEWVARAVADEKGNSVFMDLIETCHVWWVPSFKGVQRVSLAAYSLPYPVHHAQMAAGRSDSSLNEACSTWNALSSLLQPVLISACSCNRLLPVSALTMRVAMLTRS